MKSNYQNLQTNEEPMTNEEEEEEGYFIDQENINSDNFSNNDDNILLDKALIMINKLTNICAKASNIDIEEVSDASDFLNDESLFDFFVQRVESKLEVEKAAKMQSPQQKQDRLSTSNQRLSLDTYLFIKQVQNQIVSLKNTLHEDHVQLIQALFPDPETDSLLSDQSSISDQ